MKIGIIGGGASGLMAAICSKNKNNEVVILDSNNDIAKKIMITGSGKCNFWNADQDLKHFYSNNMELIKDLITDEDGKNIFKIFDNMGLIYKEKNGYYYPYSNQAITIKNMFLYEINRLNIDVKNNYLVKNIEYKNNKFIINDEDTFDKLILATGSKSYPKTGSTGFGYDILKDLGHHIYRPLPSLTNLHGNESYLKKWDGVRTDVKLSLYVDGKFIKEEVGEIQLTSYGISGICVYNISGLASIYLNQKKDVKVLINFLPFVFDCDKFLEEETKKTGKNIYDLVEGILNYKLLNVLINIKKPYTSLSDKAKKDIQNNLTKFEFKVTGTGDFNESQVCINGVSLTDVNIKTLESKIIPNLYIIGELLDITGDCGGYNLGIAFRTGYRAGRDINDKSKAS